MASPRETAMTLFQRLRRLQCSDSRGFAKCISCGKVMHYSKMDGGHYESRKNRATEMEPDNVWPQCKYCNGMLEGNKIAYRNRLLATVGPDRLQRLEDMVMASKGSSEALARLDEEDSELVLKKKTNKQYEELSKEYRTLIKRLEKEKTRND